MVVVQLAGGGVLPKVVSLGTGQIVGEHDHGVGAQLQLAALIEGLEVFQALHRGAGVDRAGEAVAEQLLLGQQEGLLLLLHSVGGHQVAHQIDSGVGQAAPNLTVVGLENLTALGIGGILGDARQLQGLAVDPAHVVVRADQDHRVVRSHRVQLLLGGVARGLPQGVQPAGALNPRAGLGLLRLLAHQLQNGLLALPVGVDLQLVLAQIVDVHVALDETGQHGLAAQIRDLRVCAYIGLCAGPVAHIQDAVVLHRHGGGGGKALIHGIDVAVDVDAVGLRRSGRQRGHHSRQHGQAQSRCAQLAQVLSVHL